jgi:hypothetical protein
MSTSSQAAALAPAATPNAAQQKRITRALNQFPATVDAAVRRLAATDLRLADLTVGFPALLVAIAHERDQLRKAALTAAVLHGEPLKQLARLASLPWWARKLPPCAFRNWPLSLPSGELASRQIGGFVPRKKNGASYWLSTVAEGNRWGHEAFAIWLAKQVDFQQRKLTPGTIQRLALWAWFSTHPETEAGGLVRQPWRPELDLKGAVKRTNTWIEAFNLQVLILAAPHQSSFRPMTVRGLEFVHLGTAALIAEEATAMRNCLVGFGHDVSSREVELWSIRKDGKRLASLSISASRADGLAGISEIRGPENRDLALDVRLAAREWFHRQDLQSLSREKAEPPRAAVRGAWVQLLKPYWLDKRTLPRWLPIAPGECCITYIWQFRG